MFAVMFGDIGIARGVQLTLGHGFILFLIALLVCIYERPLARVKFDVLSPHLAYSSYSPWFTRDGISLS
jgi:hypothetical protein